MTLSTLLGLALLAAAQAPATAPSGPERFFIGRTEGVGHVTFFGRRYAMSVRTHGRMERDGTLVLDQEVVQETRPTRLRRWRLVRRAGNRFTGTITDDRGTVTVTGSVAGDVLGLRYRTPEGPVAELEITVHRGGRSASNRLTFRRWLGVVVVVGRGEERIRRVD